MKKMKVLSCLVSAAISVNIPLSGLAVSNLVYADTTITVSDKTSNESNAYVGTEHAYDPMAELEAKETEKEFREHADIEANKVLFSVIDHRSGSEKGNYLCDNSDICVKYEFHNINMIYETKKDEYSENTSSTAYEIFYEAETNSADIWSIVDELLADENVISAEPVFVWKKSAVGDPVYVPEEEFSRATHFSVLETENVWESLKNSSMPGKGAVVAVIDTGVDYNHKDLADNIWTNSGEIPDNGIDDDGNGYIDDIHGVNIIAKNGDPMDDHGHGTHVAGAIAMSARNGGGVGLAYGAKIMCIKAGSSIGTFASTDIAKAIKYAVDNGADVINMSFGGEEKASIVEAAINDAAEYAVLVASAGNDGLPTSEAAANGYKNYKDVYPAGFKTVIGVMASDNEDHLAAFSNWDYISGKGCEYEMAAPGVDIYSTLPDNRYAVWSGTSLASANIAAAAAIIRSEYPNKSKYDARFIMGQLINASSSKATAEPDVITTNVVTTVTTTVAIPVTTVSTTTIMSDDPLVNADVDGKEGIDKDDFTYMLKCLVGLNGLGGSKGDVNCDGTADMFDAVSILRLCNDSDSVKDIMDSATIRKEHISFDIPSIDITADGDYTNYTINYISDYPFKAITGQLKYNRKAYSGEFKEVKLLSASNDDIIYEFNPENGKIAAYCVFNETSGSFTISVYEGKDGSYSIDTNSLKFYDEDGKEYFDYYLENFIPELNYHTVAQNVVATGTPPAVAVYDKKVEYPRLNIIDSLTVKPHPDMRIESVELLETVDISEANNGDGVVQPGETVGVGISIWNSWAAASDVKVKIEAVGADGKANPYVEILDNNVDFGIIGTFSGVDNGLNYNDGKIKSITAPIRIKVKENAPNDGKMMFKITLNAKNGFDADDMAVYTINGEYSFIVQNIQYIRGKIKSNISLDRSRFWIIDGDVTLNNDVTMTIKPGTQVRMSGKLGGSGIIICNGTEEEPITFIESNISANGKYKYTNFISARNINGIYDHCKFIIDDSSNYNLNAIGKLKNSIIYSNKNASAWASDAENCLFNSIGSFGDIGNHYRNVYVGAINEKCYFPNVSSLYDNHLNYNAILNNYNDKKQNFRIVEYDVMCTKAINNYYGTEDKKLIGIPEDAIEDYPDIYKSYLTLDSPEIEKIYPFMTEAYVTDEEDERIENVYPGQTLRVHLKFNRDMATDIQPDVTAGKYYGSYERIIGLDVPAFGDYSDEIDYMDYIVLGNWISPREWIGKFSIDESTEESIVYIRSEGAVAADDRWLVTGNDGGRFGFNVIKPPTIQTGDSESNKLNGKGGAGCNHLIWSQEEMATLAGYNIYRSIGDSNNFTKLNKLILSNEDLQYTDTDVITGQKYYYYFTTIDTDFNESEPSNIIEAIPLDGDKPEIVHTPVTDSEPDTTIIISADISDNVKVDKVTLYYRYSDEQEWKSVNMRNPSGSVYKNTFSAYEVKQGLLQYYIEAFDGINTANFGSAKEPCIIDIKPIVTTISITTTSTTTVTLTTTSEQITSTSSTTTVIYGPTTTSSTTTTTSTTMGTSTTTSEETSTSSTTTVIYGPTTTSSTTTTTSTTMGTLTTTSEQVTSSSSTTTVIYGPTTTSSTTTTTGTTTGTSTTTSEETSTSSTTTNIDSSTSTSLLYTTTSTSIGNSTTTTSVTTTSAITTTSSIEPIKYKLGDVNKNGVVDAVDASSVLAYYARTSTNQVGGYDEEQKLAADVNYDGAINAVDASNILSYYAYFSTTPKGEAKPMEEFMKK